ncbi:MAG: sulfatase-like hydrolase/transferase [Candidatus Poribacteria bacterium]
MNILFLFADQMHAFAMGCMGNAEIHTPHLDRLAAEGVLFRNAYSNAPVCTPYRGTLFTGRYGSQTDMLGNTAPIPAGEVTMADCLNEAGYRTSYVGKWHIGDTWNQAVPPEFRGGFTDFIGYQAHNDFLTDVWFFDEDGERHDFDMHRTDATTEIALTRLDRVAHERFAMFVSYQNPHYPIQPSPEYAAMYEGVTLTRRPNSQDVEPYTGTQSPPSPKPREEDANYQRYGGDLDEYVRLYYAMVTQLDANVGRMLEKLDDLGIADETVVVFTSDHGDLQGAHGLTNKGLAWEESSHVPQIMRVPGGRVGETCDGVVSGVDFLPTLVSLAGASWPADKEGADLVPYLLGQTDETPSRVFSEMRPWCMVRDGDWKLVAERPAVTPTHLFNLAEDPYELANLADSPEHAPVQQRLLQALTEWDGRVRRDG